MFTRLNVHTFTVSKYEIAEWEGNNTTLNGSHFRALVVVGKRLSSAWRPFIKFWKLQAERNVTSDLNTLDQGTRVLKERLQSERVKADPLIWSAQKRKCKTCCKSAKAIKLAKGAREEREIICAKIKDKALFYKFLVQRVGAPEKGSK